MICALNVNDDNSTHRPSTVFQKANLVDLEFFVTKLWLKTVIDPAHEREHFHVDCNINMSVKMTILSRKG